MVAIAAVWLVLAGQIWIFRRRLPRGTKLAIDFALAMYVLTFYLGISWLFVFQEKAIDSYYGGAMNAPIVSYISVLLLASLPLIVIPPCVYFFYRTVFFRLGTGGGMTRPIKEGAIWIGVLLTLLLIIVFNGGNLLLLVLNTLNDFRGTVGVFDIYARRQELFESLSSLQTGVLYGTLPACAAILLFFRGRVWLLARGVGLLVAISTVVGNIGLFQVGPVMVFGLMCLFCYLVLHERKVKLRWLLVFGAVGFATLAAYHAVKTDSAGSGDNRSNLVLAFSLRMPIALPYLFEMNQVAPDRVSKTDSLPHELGEFMFPNLATVGRRFVAMPVPGFIGSWFRLGAAASLITLVIAGFFIAGCGWLLRSRRVLTGAQDHTRSLMAAILVVPLLYYLFQVSLSDVLLSSYSVVYVCIPIVLITFINSVLRLLAFKPRLDQTGESKLCKCGGDNEASTSRS